MIYKDSDLENSFEILLSLRQMYPLFHKYLQNLNLKKIKNQDYLKFQI